jgi:hypothetical protein
MKLVYKEKNKKVILKTIIFIALFLIGIFAYNYHYLGNMEKEDNLDNNENLLIIQAPINDTTAPIITLVQPNGNLTIIRQSSYTIIVNISDDNPPSYGNVTIQFSNSTSILFNASMIHNGENQWSFNWDNISLYPNQIIYIFKVWAKDSSSNNNQIWSVAFYLYISRLTGPPSLNLFLYILAVSAIFGIVVVYINKRGIYKSTRKKKRKSSGTFSE